MQAILDAVDMASVLTWVGAIGLVIVGVAMAFKGIDLAKRGVRKA
jgi:NADH:ubiquinone oxidoreductase subunit 6 (subunit J)